MLERFSLAASFGRSFTGQIRFHPNGRAPHENNVRIYWTTGK